MTNNLFHQINWDLLTSIALILTLFAVICTHMKQKNKERNLKTNKVKRKTTLKLTHLKSFAIITPKH